MTPLQTLDRPHDANLSQEGTVCVMVIFKEYKKHTDVATKCINFAANKIIFLLICDIEPKTIISSTVSFSESLDKYTV